MNLPASSTVAILATADKRDELLVTVENFITPTTLVRVTAAGAVTTVQSLPALFDSSNMAVTQYFAASKDGTKVPYFVVRRKDVDRAAGVLVHAYGGFNAAQTPTYLDRSALSLGAARPVPGRGRQCLRPRQHPRRRRIWPGVAPRRAARKAAEQLRRSRGGGARPDGAGHRAARFGGDLGPLERRRAGRRGDQPEPRSLCRDHRRLALVRHAALFETARRRVVDRPNMAIPTSPRTGPS